mgnify:CR=1 FL=1
MIEYIEFNRVKVLKINKWELIVKDEIKDKKNFYPQIENSKLNTANRFLGYEFDHHDALADALACSNILINISKELGNEDIDEICRCVGVTIGNVNEEGYKPSSVKGRIFRKSSRVSTCNNSNSLGNPNYDVFKGDTVVFTGRLSSMTRDEAIRLVRRLGGASGSSVTKKTTILVSNIKDIHELKRNEMSTKMRKAVDLKLMGQKIDFIDEDEFIKKSFM